MSFSAKDSLYIDNFKELFRVLSWMGIIMFWLTFWLPKGIYLGGESVFLGVFFPQMEIIIPISVIGILLVFVVNFLKKYSQEGFLNSFLRGSKAVGLWLSIILVISIFSRDFRSSVLFLPIWLISMMTILGSKDFLPNTFSKKILITISTFIGFIAWKFFPDLNISIDLLALFSVFGLLFLSEEIPRNSAFIENVGRIVMQILFIFIVFQGSSLIFPLAALFVLIFSQKLFIFRRGEITPDLFGIAVLLIFAFFKIYNTGLYFIDFQQVIPGFWTNFREILFGVGVGQFLPALQSQSDTLLSLSELKTPGSGLLFVQFEQGIMGLIAIGLLFLSSMYIHKKRSTLYIILMLFLFIFSSVFVDSENGIILLVLFLFLNINRKATTQ